MSDLSPCGALVAALLSITLCAFYVTHLWKFDRFRCLNFMRDRQGAFKRFMTYSYPVGVLTVAIFWVGSAVIKYKEGFVTLSNGTVLPKPFELWTPQNLGARFPLIMLNAVAWGAEAVSHLEELCFWFFLIHAGPSPTPWFRSIYFKIWLGGSVLAVALTFVTTIVTRADPVKNEVWQMFVGSVTGLLITIGFLPVLWVFPNFVRKVKEEGADVDAVVRLVKFHDLNIIRIVFRFMFVVPGVLFSIEGFNPNTHIINEGMFGADLLLAISSIGLVVQSSITLMIFFPRDLELETTRWLDGSAAERRRVKVMTQSSRDSTNVSKLDTGLPKTYLLSDSPVTSKVELPTQTYEVKSLQHSLSYDYPPRSHPWDNDSMTILDQREVQHQVYRTVTGGSLALTEENLGVFTKSAPQVNPLALFFTSPIELSDVPHRRSRQ